MHPKSVSIAPPLGGTRDECGNETGLEGHPDRGSDSDAGMLYDGGTLGRVPPARGTL
jgi:hypothetical protein